jgi:hypothetical protein
MIARTSGVCVPTLSLDYHSAYNATRLLYIFLTFESRCATVIQHLRCWFFSRYQCILSILITIIFYMGLHRKISLFPSNRRINVLNKFEYFFSSRFNKNKTFFVSFFSWDENYQQGAYNVWSSPRVKHFWNG